MKSSLALVIAAYHLATAGAQSNGTDAMAPSNGYEMYSDKTITDALGAIDPPYTVLVHVDYNSEKQDGFPAPRQQLRDVHNGGITVTDAIDCATECNKRSSCNMASYYGEVADWKDARNCWLKDLQELPCSYPADLEEHSDNRLLLLARPPSDCSASPLYAPLLPPQPSEAPQKETKNPPDTISTPGSNQNSPPDSTDPAQKETIQTDEEKQKILGNRQMDPSVPKAFEIENSALALKWDSRVVISFALAILSITV